MAIFGLGGGIVGNFITPYLKSLGVSESVIGFLVSAGALGAMLVSMPGGRLADALGPKSTIIIYMSSVSMLIALFPVLAFPAAAMAIYVMHSATRGLDMPSTTPYIYGTTKMHNRAKGMSFYMLTFYVGGIAGPVIGGYVADNIGMRYAFIASALVCAAALLSSLALPSPSSLNSAANAKRPIFSISDIKEMFAVPGFKGLVFRGIALQVLNGISTTVFSIFIIYYLGLTKQSAGFVFGLASVAGLITTPIGGLLSDKIGRKIPVVIGCLVGAVCFSLVPLASAFPQEMRFPAICLLAAAQSAGFGLSNPSIMALMAETMPQGRIGTGMGVYYTVATIGWVAGAPIAGVLFEANPIMPFMLGGLVTLASVIIFVRFVPETSGKKEITSP